MGNPGGCEAGVDRRTIESAVLDAYIIEEIKRQEAERRQREQSRPRLRIEIPRPMIDDRDRDRRPSERDEEDERDAVIRIEL